MPRELTIDELMQKQREMVAKAERLATEKDVDAIQGLTKELERDGLALQELAQQFEAQELAKAGPPPRGSLEVMLTPDQRQRVQALTGVDLESVVVNDEMGVLSKAMPMTDPRDIELLAIAQARRKKADRDADGTMRSAVEQALADVEEQGMPELRQELERLRADPSWLGGLARKK